MHFSKLARLLLVSALAGVALSLPGADVGMARPKPAPAAPPPPPPLPEVSLAARFVNDAAAFESYMRRAALISPAFTDSQGVARALRVGAAYRSDQVLRGEIAYAAIAALQSPVFVAAVREAGATPEGRYAVVRRIFADPGAALTFKGADAAAGLARQALTGDGMRLFTAGKSVRQAAYDIQRQPWSLQDVEGRDQRLDAVKGLDRTPMPAATDVAGQLQEASTGRAVLNLSAEPYAHPHSQLLVRAVALAALGAIGEAGEAQADNVGWLLQDYFTAHCLAEAKLALNECLAVARPNYEDVFCLGQHVMADTGACVVRGGGGTVPIEIATRPLKVPPAHGAAAGKHGATHRRHAH
ncbi:MAG: hypothetical protein JO127_06945 [Caulobacteraceae bacterium]|nr:hypothetical protein [Caulobacteraceae bacterium]